MEECIHLTTQPTQLIASYPYLFALVKNYLYVYNLPSLTRIQKIPLEGHFHIVPYDDAFLLYSVHNIYRLGLLSAHDQIEMLLGMDPPMFQQALIVASNHDLDKEIVQKLHVRYGYYLFSLGLFDDAMNQFSQVESSLMDVLVLFHELRFPGVSSQKWNGSFIDRSEQVNPYRPPELTPTSRRRAYEALVGYLKEQRIHENGSLPDSAQESTHSHPDEATASLVDNVFISSFIHIQALVLTLIALQAGDEIKEILLASNHCDIQVIEERLVTSIQKTSSEPIRMMLTLSLLYLFEGKQQYKRVFTINCSDAQAVEVVLYQLQRCRTQSPERTQLLHIFTHILYGLESCDESLVFKCSERIYMEVPDLVMRCFINDDGLIGHLNIYHVTKHLLALTAKENTVYERNKLALEYLWVVVPHMNASQPPEFNLAHTLAKMYVDTICDLLQTNPDDERVPQMRSRLQSLLKTNHHCIPDELLEALPANMHKERCVGDN